MRQDRRLPKEVTTLLSMIERVVLGFDRYRILLDTPAPELPIAAIKRLGGKIKIGRNTGVRFQPLWPSYLSLHQPSEEASRLLADAILSKRYRTRVDYAELAIDCITSTPTSANAVGDFFLAHLLVPTMKFDVFCSKGTTYYYCRRASEISVKARLVPVLYSDRKSKLASEYVGQNCSHLEYRFTGSAALSGIGIACMADIAEFSHETFWRRHLKLARLPSKTDIGHFLAPGGSDCSGTALRKRANKFLEAFRVEGHFVIQNLWRSHPEISNILTPVDNALLLDELRG